MGIVRNENFIAAIASIFVIRLNHADAAILPLRPCVGQKGACAKARHIGKKLSKLINTDFHYESSGNQIYETVPT